MPDFLLEIGCEEIPARMIDARSQELRERLTKLLERERLAPTGAVTYLDTPRRLAVLASGIPAAQPDVTEQVTGPSVQVAYKDGQPTPAAHAFAKKAGVDVGASGKGDHAQGRISRRDGHAKRTIGRRDSCRVAAERNRVDLLAEEHVLAQARRSALCVRCAGWSRCSTTKWCRWSSSGSRAGKTSRGHRILGSEDVVNLHARAPTSRPCAAARSSGRRRARAEIRKALDAATRTIPGARWREDKALARYGGQSHGISFGDSGQLRSGISRTAGRSAGHGDARSSEIFRGRRCGRQAAAAFSGGAEYGLATATD